MGKRGPKRQATETKRRRGNPGKENLSKPEPTPPPGDPVRPDWLDELGREKWPELCESLRSMGLLAKTDVDAIAAYCQAYSEYRQAVAFMHQHGRVIFQRDAKGKIKASRPVAHVAIANRAQDFMRRFWIDYGLTPSARGSISIPQTVPRPGASAQELTVPDDPVAGLIWLKDALSG